MTSADGLRIAEVSEWISANVADAVAPFSFELVLGGHSNLTFKATAANGERFVVRRPPLGNVLASAHDVGREFRILSGLRESAVPVPDALGYCDDPAVNDAPFYVMRFVDGAVLRDRAGAEAALDEGERHGVSESLVDTMAAIHSVDLAAVGLSDLGRHEGYIARQLKRWYSQWNQQKTKELPALDAVHDELSRRIPDQGRATLVHGDYRLDNCIIANGHVAAVLDWEICTLGDPLADLGMLQVYWSGPNDAPSAWNSSATTAPGFLNRSELADRYGHVSGRDLTQLPFYVRVCVLEAGLHHARCVCALSRRSPRSAERERPGTVHAASCSRGCECRGNTGAIAMSERYELHQELPQLDEPVLVVHLTGWIDASGAGAAALTAIDAECDTKPLATFDGDAFIDYRARRPTMELRDGVNTKLTWEDIELRVGRDPNERPVLTLIGPEPDSRWREFAAIVTDLAGKLGVRQMVALGAYPYATPHTRPPRLSSSSPSAEVLANLPYLKNSVDVAAGMSSVLEHALSDVGIASLGMWVQVPHYVSAMSYPAATVALLQGLREVTGIVVSANEAVHEAEIQRHRIDRLVAANEEHGAMVSKLEGLYDQAGEQTMSLGDAQIPTGDDLAAEFERFLREQDN